MPPPGLMPEMDASLQQLLHSDFWQNSSLFLESNEAGEAQGGTRSTLAPWAGPRASSPGRLDERPVYASLGVFPRWEPRAARPTPPPSNPGSPGGRVARLIRWPRAPRPRADRREGRIAIRGARRTRSGRARAGRCAGTDAPVRARAGRRTRDR